jgi:hypothetical protein
MNITPNLKLDNSYFIDNLSKWNIWKFIHKFPSTLYTILHIYINSVQKKVIWILLLNNISMIIFWKK